MIYYWIEAQHSGKVLEVERGSACSFARIIQRTKKSGDDPSVDSQLWYYNGAFITNKNSGLVIDVTRTEYENGTQIIQYHKWDNEPVRAQEWEYNCEDNTINSRFDQSFVLSVANGSKENSAPIILYKKNGLPHQKFILHKFDDASNASGSLITNIIDNNKFLPKLSQNFLEILDDDEYYDINIEVGNDPYVRIFHAHTNILYYRSPYLKRILSTNEKKSDGTLLQIKLPNILPEIFQIILRYIYGGRLSLKEYDTSDIINILVAAGELSLHELITHIQSFLIKNKGNWMEQNFDLIYKISFENNSFLELQKYCVDLISKDPDKIFKSSSFSSISEDLLVSLIQNDNLQMREAQIWEYVIKWGLAQNPELSSADPTNYSDNDFITLKNTLQQCIPLIKFRNLTSKEFSDKVLPYRKILSEELFMNLLRDFLNNDSNPAKPVKELETLTASEKIIEIRSNNIDSKIITLQHAELISRWANKTFCEFRLLFRASRDGFDSEKFHEICDYQSHTITIVKVKGSDEILGGFNPIKWKSGDTWGVTNDSFIFSFKNNDNIKDYVLSRVANRNNAIYNESFGPSFGGGDLIIWGIDFNTLCNYCSSSKTSYEKPIRETEDKFSVEECEVFRLIFKFQEVISLL